VSEERSAEVNPTGFPGHERLIHDRDPETRHREQARKMKRIRRLGVFRRYVIKSDFGSADKKSDNYRTSFYTIEKRLF